MPHPSDSNAERIAYFLGRKPREALSNKTNPDKYDQAKALMKALTQAVRHHSCISDAQLSTRVYPECQVGALSAPQPYA